MKRGLAILSVLLFWGSLLPAQVADRKPLDRTQVLPGIHEKLIGQDHCVKCHDATQRANDAKCLDCHKEIQAQLERPVSYHRNVVRGESKRCEDCHKEHQGEAAKLTVWSDQAGMKQFDHQKTGYPLHGAHAKLDCDKCHQPENFAYQVTQRTDQRESFLGLSDRCVSCHKDVHLAKLGTDCARCHTFEDWKQLVPNAPFDHAKTDYALKGKHSLLECKDCHTTEKMIDPIKFDACQDCHDDRHQGQLRDRADGGRCNACHDVYGFKRPNYSIEDHRQSRFPLEGGHRAVACNECHKPITINGQETVQLEFESLACQACHETPTEGHVSDLEPASQACKHCHTTERWKRVQFDHDQTDYKLTGSHITVACTECHTVTFADTPRERVQYADLKTDCIACHQDVHVGQFARKSCTNCHTTEDWRKTTFDHQKDSEYALVGKHRDAKCEQCHRVETAADGTRFRRYKPVDTDCRTCHARDGSVLSVFGTHPLPGTGRP